MSAKKITMDITDRTQNNISYIKENTNWKTRTQVFVSSTEVVKNLLESVKDGGKVIIRKDDVEREILITM